MSEDQRDPGLLQAVEEAARRADDAQKAFRDSIMAAKDGGWYNSDIAPRARLTKQRIGQILRPLGRGEERAFWGHGDDGLVVVAVGEKLEGPKTAAGPLGPVVTTESREAYDILRTVLDSQGLDAEYEPIPATTGGYVDLNRDGLVVICGPRLSPFVGQILASDKMLGFERDDEGWYLRDRQAGNTWRSPLDTGENVDYAYLGRLPRPDGQGHFLYIGGIHAPGTAGAALYLRDHLPELWQQVKNSRFSLLLRCTFTGARHVTDAALVAGPYLHER